jgi:hypothetical protein
MFRRLRNWWELRGLRKERLEIELELVRQLDVITKEIDALPPPRIREHLPQIERKQHKGFKLGCCTVTEMSSKGELDSRLLDTRLARGKTLEDKRRAALPLAKKGLENALEKLKTMSGAELAWWVKRNQAMPSHPLGGELNEEDLDPTMDTRPKYLQNVGFSKPPPQKAASAEEAAEHRRKLRETERCCVRAETPKDLRGPMAEDVSIFSHLVRDE